MIKFTINAELTAEPRPNQLTNETVRESLQKQLEDPKTTANGRARAERALTGLVPRTGRDASGEDYTLLRMRHDGRRLEISASGKLAHDVVAQMAVGETYRISVELLGESPHYRMRLRQWRRLGIEDREAA